MDENKEFLNSNNEESVEDTAEEIAEETVEEAMEDVAEETLEETAEDMAEEVSEAVEANEDFSESFDKEVEVPKKKKPVVPIIIAAAIVVLAAALFIGNRIYMKSYNPYNHMGYINTTGDTIADVAEKMGMTLEEFLAEYDLPADMRADTEEAAAYYMIPVSKIAEMYYTDFETFANYYGLDESVTADTPWGEALDSMTLNKMVGEEYLEEFIEEYELGENVNGDTKWGEVRRQVDKINYERTKAQEKEAETAEDIPSDEYVDIEE